MEITDLKKFEGMSVVQTLQEIRKTLPIPQLDEAIETCMQPFLKYVKTKQVFEFHR